mmetsp:Transcript_64419/g.151348  ORF Transcript_64419/g.151348 Transcript_64419/m.151348 type:complete len:201 (-) Transcript_64419:224-826(-)
MEGNEELAQRRPESDHSTNIPAQTLRLHCDHAKETCVDAFSHGPCRVNNALCGKMLTLRLAVHCFQPGEAQAEKCQRGEDCACEVLRHGQSTEYDTLPSASWNITKNTVLVDEPALCRDPPEREAGQTKACCHCPQENHEYRRFCPANYPEGCKRVAKSRKNNIAEEPAICLASQILPHVPSTENSHVDPVQAYLRESGQ